MAWENDVLRSLNEQGCRMTGPRRLIVRTIASRREPFTAEQLVAELPDVGRATIYRTLDMLAASHWLARIHHDEGDHAYLPAHPHQHQLVCTRCGTAVAFNTCDLDGILSQLGKSTGFVIQGHALEAFGLCGQCQHNRPELRLNSRLG